jgi:hypothetical protein
VLQAASGGTVLASFDPASSGTIQLTAATTQLTASTKLDLVTASVCTGTAAGNGLCTATITNGLELRTNTFTTTAGELVSKTTFDATGTPAVLGASTCLRTGSAGNLM